MKSRCKSGCEPVAAGDMMSCCHVEIKFDGEDTIEVREDEEFDVELTLVGAHVARRLMGNPAIGSASSLELDTTDFIGSPTNATNCRARVGSYYGSFSYAGTSGSNLTGVAWKTGGSSGTPAAAEACGEVVLTEIELKGLNPTFRLELDDNECDASVVGGTVTFTGGTGSATKTVSLHCGDIGCRGTIQVHMTATLAGLSEPFDPEKEVPCLGGGDLSLWCC